MRTDSLLADLSSNEAHLQDYAKNRLIDTGPLVAALRERDEHHEWARAYIQATTKPFVSCEAVISESLFLLERARDGKEALCGLGARSGSKES